MNDLIPISEWHTPASDYPLNSVGKAAITRHRYTKGIYHAHKAKDGAEFFQAVKPLWVTNLKIGRSIWMVDDPPHWWQIQSIAAKLHGRVLVGGLGLGLIVWACAKVSAITELVIVERDQDVIDLVAPLLPRNKPLSFVQSDFYSYILDERNGPFNSAFVDLWVSKSPNETRHKMYTSVIPTALAVGRRHGIPMYCLGFNGDEPFDFSEARDNLPEFLSNTSLLRSVVR